MAYVVAAYWRARAGEEETIARILEQLTPLSRQEPGCLFYQAHRATDDPRLFFLYEQYVDAAAYEAHMATPHFEQYVKGEALPRLESRERHFFTTMEASDPR
jgi:quinol monooxygenase YgiN